MSNLFQESLRKVDIPPGTPVYIGEKRETEIRITVIDYDQESLMMSVSPSVEDCFPYKETSTVTWINVDGIHDPSLVDRLGKYYGLHSLSVEDILDTKQQPRIDFFDDHIIVILKMLTYKKSTEEVDIEQVSLILGENFVITFQEKEGDVFEPIRNRLKLNQGRIRRAGTDYLAYSLLDAVVDGYFEVIEALGEVIEFVEDEVLSEPALKILKKIYSLKREILFLRKSVWPLRGMIHEFDRQHVPFVKDPTKIYFRDLYDHVAQVIDTIETYREMITGVLEVYLSSVSNKMNEIMKFLTIIGTIFIPLTFIVGVYGMNFKYMPELEWRWGYFVIIFLMVAIGSLLVLYFKKKKWI